MVVIFIIFFQLGRDPARQNTLRNEILEKLGKNTDFDTLVDLEYLDACIHGNLNEEEILNLQIIFSIYLNRNSTHFSSRFSFLKTLH